MRKSALHLTQQKCTHPTDRTVIDYYAEIREYARELIRQAETDPDRTCPTCEYLGLRSRQLWAVRCHLEEDPYGD